MVESVFKRTEQETSKDKFYLCHSGNLSRERDPELTFQALRDIINQGFSGFEFHIMGHINDYTLQLIQKYDLTDYVKCIGGYPYLTAIDKLQHYDVLVLLEAKLKKGSSLLVNLLIMHKQDCLFLLFPQRKVLQII